MKASLFVLTSTIFTASLFACASTDTTGGTTSTDEAPVLRSDVKPVTRVEDAKPGVFIPPFEACREPVAGESATRPDGKVCANVSIAGATESGRSFAGYASCDVVRTQRPYYPASPAKEGSASDPRLSDAAFMTELAWAKSQIAASGCVCCHDATVTPRGASQWDISKGPIWLDTLSDNGLALFAGYADSSVLGAYPADKNHGFDRTATGIPTTDTARMKRFLGAELSRRGLSEEKARAVAPFGGPIYDNAIKPPTTCGAGEGVAPDGRILWNGGSARYVYVLEAGSKNPGVPPNLDRPAGTVWKLDVLASADAVASGLGYGKTPAGSFQDVPGTGRAPELVKGKSYVLYVLKDVGLPLTNCSFSFGNPVSPATAPAPSGDAGAGFGATCSDDSGCSAPASYCAKMPGAPTGFCTRTGCKTDQSICPPGWGCFDSARFQPGGPNFCQKP